MSEPQKGSFIGRFAMKFIEVLGAGIATAVGSYLVAHLSGYWSAPAQAPAAVQVAPAVPNTTLVTKAPRGDVPSAKPAAETPASTTTAQPPRTTAATAAASGRKRNPADAGESKADNKAQDKEITEAKPREKDKETEGKSRERDKETAESKPRDKDDKDSVEAQVRAALANVDAGRQQPAAPKSEAAAKPEAATKPEAAPKSEAAAKPEAAPKSETPAGAAAVAAVPNAGGTPAAVQPATAQTEPLTPVEIRSHPIADINSARLSAGADAQDKTDNPQGNDKGLFAALKKIPEFFRTDMHPADDPPRPPNPVGGKPDE